MAKKVQFCLNIKLVIHSLWHKQRRQSLLPTSSITCFTGSEMHDETHQGSHFVKLQYAKILTDTSAMVPLVGLGYLFKPEFH